ncbi:type II toxin-antitoxin system PemK/MazF family toxin [Paenarthrobacter sp. NPDC092416]|uniref:type II toxin-antitoxin system PemK/MazF family toxin n=1 Tax=Paenarthrobacter sp. NPDC092416 TaxID=3364386 RepID=UPI00382B27F2
MALDLRPLGKLIMRSLKVLGGKSTPSAASQRQRTARTAVDPSTASYPGDFQGTAKVFYSPKPDGQPDPGEIVWSWVPYEEDHSQGKDRPVLIVARDGAWLLGLMLTSKDHDNDTPDYVDIGTGSWDRQRRPSEVKLDRIIRVNPGAVRREGAVLDNGRFQGVARELRARHGWN